MNDPAGKIFEFGPFRLDSGERVLLRDGKPVALTLKAFGVLLLLVENSGHIVEKNRLMDHVWAGTFVEEGNLKATVSMLRKALADNQGNCGYIETVARRGYRFVSPVREVVDESTDVVVHERTRQSIIIDEPQSVSDRWGNKRPLYLMLGASLVVLGILALVFSLRSRSQPTALQVSNPVIKSIAVLPFKPIVAETADESLELGLADTLISRLNRQRHVTVRPTSAIRRYAGLDQEPVAAGRELRVDAVLDGSIQKSGENVRVTVRLISVASGEQLWADIFDQKSTDIFVVQDSIARQVIQAITTLSKTESEVVARRDTQNYEAYTLYMKGRYFWNKRTQGGLKKSIHYFNQAIAQDPNYALAYAGLADAYVVLPGHTDASMSETHPQARAYALRALHIDSQLPEAHVTLATIAADHWHWEEADRQFKQAIELNPNYAVAHQWYGEYLVHAGRLDDALRELKLAQQLDPTSPIISVLVGQVLYFQRRYDDAIRQYELTLEFDRDFDTAHWLLGVAFMQKSMHEAAISSFEKAAKLSGNARRFTALVAAAHARSGKPGVALSIANKLNVKVHQKGTIAREMAIIYTALGDKNKAFEWLEKAYDVRSDLMLFLRVDPFFDPLRSDARFSDLLRRVGPT